MSLLCNFTLPRGTLMYSDDYSTPSAYCGKGGFRSIFSSHGVIYIIIPVSIMMANANDVCDPCIIFRATRLQNVGLDREATCPGMRLAGDDETLIELIKSRRAGRAPLRVHKTRRPNGMTQFLTMPCEVAPALLFPGSSAIQPEE